MEALVVKFNHLARPEKTPSGIPSHWHFSVRNVPIPPSSDLLQIVNPESRFMHSAGPKQILALSTLSSQADAIVPLLLETFVAGINRGPKGEQIKEIPLFAPWSWATNNSDLAKALEKKLKAVGVRSELCTVSVGPKADDDVADDVWKGFLASLFESMGVRDDDSSATAIPGSNDAVKCAGCKHGSSTFDHPLKKCAGCAMVQYCSKECQKRDWKYHKLSCKKMAESAARAAAPVQTSTTDSTSTPAKTATAEGSKSMPPHLYWNTVVKTVPEAVELAKSLNIDLGAKGLSKPIRRLVLTGQDTPSNYEILLGSGWERESATIEETRIEVLLDAPKGSPNYVLYKNLDEGAPTRSPRPATRAENKRIQEVRNIQAMVKKLMGERKEPTTQDMMAVLGMFGNKWNEMMPVYTLAVNTMDQGVQV